MIKMNQSTPLIRCHINSWLSSWCSEFFTIVDILVSPDTDILFCGLPDMSPTKAISNELLRLERHHKLIAVGTQPEELRQGTGRPPKIYKKNMIFRENKA